MSTGMYNGNLYEKMKLLDRFKDILVLALFTIAVAISSVAAMNLLVYPVTIFAIKNKQAFNFIMTDVLLFVLMALFAACIGRRVYGLRKEGLSTRDIALYLIRKPMHYIAIFLFFLAISLMMVFLLYALFSNNFYLLYKLTNN